MAVTGNSAAKRSMHERKIQHLVTFVFPVAYINQLRRQEIPVVRVLETKSKKLEQKIKKKTVSFENSFILLVSDFCTKGFSGCTNAENDV